MEQDPEEARRRIQDMIQDLIQDDETQKKKQDRLAGMIRDMIRDLETEIAELTVWVDARATKYRDCIDELRERFGFSL